MINWKSLYIVLGLILGGIGTLLLSAELVMLALAFMGSAALQVWLDHRSNSADRRLAKHDSLIAGKS
jgi:hypothetical protein